jgi:3-oxoadipate enol-lactonase
VVAASVDADEYFYAGVSLGGAVGLHLALRDHRMRGTAAICSGAIIGSPTGWYDRAALVRASGTSALLDALPAVDDESYALCCEALASHDLRSELPRIAVPVLAAWGEHDLVTPAIRSEEIAAGVRNGGTCRIAHAGHLAPLERPDDLGCGAHGRDERAPAQCP